MTRAHHHQCIRIADREIYLAIERLYPFVRRALFERILELQESGRISGIQSDVDTYIGVEVEIDEEFAGYLSQQVYDIVAFFEYSK